jgi:hypothetical protein
LREGAILWCSHRKEVCWSSDATTTDSSESKTRKINPLPCFPMSSLLSLIHSLAETRVLASFSLLSHLRGACHDHRKQRHTFNPFGRIPKAEWKRLYAKTLPNVPLAQGNPQEGRQLLTCAKSLITNSRMVLIKSLSMGKGSESVY